METTRDSSLEHLVDRSGQSVRLGRRRFGLILVAALLFVEGPTTVVAQGRAPAAVLRADSFIRIARDQSRSVVFLHTIERESPRDETEGLGSGVVVGSGGLILTNAHVVENASEVHVRLTDGTDVSTTLIGRDSASDLALLRAADATGLVPVTFGDSDLLDVGAHVVAIGNPLGLHHTVTAGIVSAKARGLDDSSLELIQTDAAINQGSSGGGLFDLRGRLVGITSNIVAPRGGGNIGLNFAIPVNVVKALLPQLRTGSVRHGWLGVASRRVTSPVKNARGESITALEVRQTTPGSPAERAGLQRGDLLLHARVPGAVIPANTLHQAVWLAQPGTTIELSVWRDGRTRTVRVTLADVPEKR